MDLYNLPDKSQKVQIFTTSGMWHKPRGISMVYIHIVGGGGGGNGGGTGALGTVRAGGGGGAGGNTSKLCLPAVLISDSLVIEIGRSALHQYFGTFYFRTFNQIRFALLCLRSNSLRSFVIHLL